MEHKAKSLAFTLLPPFATDKPGEIVDARDIDLVYLTEQASKNDVTDEDLEALGKEEELCQGVERVSPAKSCLCQPAAPHYAEGELET